MEEKHEEISLKALLPALGISAVLIIIVLFAIQYAKTKPSSIVLPGGITYLGPSPTQAPANSGKTFGNVLAGQIPIPENATWETYKGKQLPYAFSYPTTIQLGVFPNDPYDSVTVFYNGTESQSNLFFRVEDLNKLNKASFIKQEKIEYANSWWKDYNWTGVASVTPFTNKEGLVGYRAKYKDASGNTPYDHVFFEVPNRPDLIIWITGKLFTQTVFDRLVDSVSWTK
jgi:hypothetical protein